MTAQASATAALTISSRQRPPCGSLRHCSNSGIESKSLVSTALITRLLLPLLHTVLLHIHPSYELDRGFACQSSALSLHVA